MSLTFLVCVSLIGLAVGPVVAAVSRGHATAAAALDGLALGLVPTVLLVRIFPHLCESLGAVAVVLGAVGYAGIWWADRANHAQAERVAPAIVFPALVVHSFTDGALLGALAISTHLSAVNAPVCAALVVHRMPESLFLATAAPGVDLRRTWLRVGGLMAATIVGAVAGGSLLSLLPDRVFDAVAALGFGAILRLSTHSHAAALRTTSARAISGLAFVCGVALVAAIRSPGDILRVTHAPELSLLDSALAFFVETSPSILTAVAIASALRPLRADAASWVAPLAGLLLSMRFLGLELTLIRVAAIALLAAAAGSWKSEPAASTAPTPSLFDLLGTNAAAYLVGLIGAAALEALLPPGPSQLAAWGLLVAVSLAALLRPIGVTPMVAVLVHKKLPVGPVLAFTVVAGLSYLWSVAAHRQRLVVATVATAVSAGVAATIVGAENAPALHDLMTHHHSLAERACAVALTLLVVATLVALGPRRWLGAAATRS
ncbi:MAG: hypothetical protein JWM53_5239 [bacterium]|nr:hypothetical protein [bacterium]